VVECADLWAAWWAGNQVDQCQLAGLSVLALGRWGKAFQFFAGLAVVLDLLDEKKLRDSVTRAQERINELRSRARAARRMFELDDVREEVTLSLVRAECANDAAVASWYVNHAPASFGPTVPFTEEEYAAFRATTLGALASRHRCSPGAHHPDYVCTDQGRFVNTAVARFLETRWSPEQRRLIEMARRKRRRAMIPGMVAGVGGVGAMAMASKEESVGRTAVLLLLSMILMTVMSLAAAPTGWRLGAPMIWLREVPTLTARRLAVWLIGTSRPFHGLRWLAVALFIPGFLLDLLAS